MNDFDYLAQLPGEEAEQNWIRERLKTLSARESVVLTAAARKAPPANTVDAINQIQSLDYYCVQCGVDGYEQLGELYLRESFKIPEDARPFVNLAQLGKQYASKYPGQFVGNCYVMDPEFSVSPRYKGQGKPLPSDVDWSVKLKLASPAVPDGVWMRLPWLTGLGDYTTDEEKMTFNELQAESWDECVLLDAQCIYPEACDLMKQYSNMADLVNDSKMLGYFLSGDPFWSVADLECYIAAMELEDCKNLKQALDICHNINCYDWVPRAQLEDHTKEALQKADVSDDLIQSGAIDLRSYGAHLLESQGYTLSADESGYIARNSQAFVYKYSPQPVSDSLSNDNVMVRGGCEQASDFAFLTQLPGTKQEQDWLKERLETLSVREGVILSAAAMRNPPEDMAQAINCLQSLDGYEVRIGAGSYEALGQAYLCDKTNVPEDALLFADLEQMGQYYEDQHPGLFVGNCYVEYPPTDSQPVYRGQGSLLPCDHGWSVKLKVAPPAVPEGVWLRLPGPFLEAPEGTVEEALALQELKVQCWDECALLDARCVLPEAGDLVAQYAGDVGDLIYDGIELGFVLAQKGQGMPCFTEKYAAALALEGCQTLKLALDISQNLRCYNWAPRASLEDSGRQKLMNLGISEELIRASGIDLAGYKAHLLEQEGYTPTADGWGYVRRSSEEFHYQFSTPAQPQEEPGMAMQ